MTGGGARLVGLFEIFDLFFSELDIHGTYIAIRLVHYIIYDDTYR